MHTEALAWVASHGTTKRVAVLDIGGRNINGSPRGLFPNASYTVLDITAGDGVDIVADAATWTPRRRYDVVVCTEVFEHTPLWPEICVTARAACVHIGQFIVTCAGPGREPHSAVDGGPLRAGEYYANVTERGLRDALRAAGFRHVTINSLGTDLRAVALVAGHERDATMSEGTPIDRNKLLSLGFLPRGRTRDRVREGRRPDGVRIKATTDQLGNTVTEHASKDSRVDVTVRAPTVAASMTVDEKRD